MNRRPRMNIVIPDRVIDGTTGTFTPPLAVRDRADVYRASVIFTDQTNYSVVLRYEMAEMNPNPDFDW